MEKNLRVRFAPSPTGHLHLGGARTALYDVLLAKQTGGKFILRIEDTDRSRLVDGAEKELMDSLKWMGIDWDEGPDTGGDYGPYRQFERKEIYSKFATQLLESGKAYYCFCTPDRLEKVRQEQQKRKEAPHYDGTCRNLSQEEASKRVTAGERHVLRFKTPKEGSTSVRDVIRGEIIVENRTIDDYILVRSDGLALYHLAAMVDDHEMKITHVIRGSEWLSTLPLHALVIRALNWEEPEWIHLSVFLKPSGKGKMSKREAAEAIKDGHSIFIKDLQGLGYLPEAVINWIALMGWSYDDHTEFFSMSDLIEKFSLHHLNPSPAAINFTKLDYFNGLHIRNLPCNDLAIRIKPFFIEKGFNVSDEMLKKIAPIVRERITTLDESVDMAGFFFRDTIHPQKDDLSVKGLTHDATMELLSRIIEVLKSVQSFTVPETEPKMRELVEQLGLTAGQVFGIMRVAVTGQKISPPLFESMEIIGKEIVLQRLSQAIEILKMAE
jgi:glutamyl-tRNA synthetase